MNTHERFLSADSVAHQNCSSVFGLSINVPCVVAQTSLLQYFWQTREESFFAAIRTRIHLAALAIKEK